MQSTRPENSSLKINPHDKFFSKLLSKEASDANSSYPILYYDGAVRTVPFVWEACPGTPKRLPTPSHSFDSAHAYNLKLLLTPPPYYLARQGSKFLDTAIEAKMRRDRKFLSPLLSMLGQKRPVVSRTCSVSSSKSSSSSWQLSMASPSPLVQKSKSLRERHVLFPCSRFDDAGGQDHGDAFALSRIGSGTEGRAYSKALWPLAAERGVREFNGFTIAISSSKYSMFGKTSYHCMSFGSCK